MHLAINAVLEFHERMGLTIGDPVDPDISVDKDLRLDLIQEEFEELKLALEGKRKDGSALTKQEQIIEVADALADLAYVIAGAAVTWGIDLGPVFDAVHDSNMSKEPGNKRSDGKLLKGPSYEPPQIEQALDESKREILRIGYVSEDNEDAFWPQPTVKKGS